MKFNLEARKENGFHGKSIETVRHIGPGEDRYVKMTTMKRSSGWLTSTANIVGINDSGNGFISLTWAMGDPSETLVKEDKRATWKALEEQHALALTKLDEFVAKHAPKEVEA